MKLSSSSPTASAEHVNHVVNYFRSHGFTPIHEAFCFGRYRSVIEQSCGRVPLSRISQAFQLFSMISQDPFFGFKLALSDPLFKFQLLLNIFQPTDWRNDEGSIDEIALFNDVFELSFRKNSGDLELLINTAGTAWVSQYQFDAVLMVVKKAIEYFYPNSNFEWHIPRKIDNEAREGMCHYLGGEVISEAECYKVVIPEKMINPLPTQSPGVRDSNKLSLSKKQTEISAQYHLLQQIWQAMERTFPSKDAKLQTVAGLCGLSVRQMQYKLNGLGVSYQQLVDDYFMEAMIKILLEEENKTAEHISAQLGFTEMRSYKRAVKRWFDAPFSEVSSHILDVQNKFNTV